MEPRRMLRAFKKDPDRTRVVVEPRYTETARGTGLMLAHHKFVRCHVERSRRDSTVRFGRLTPPVLELAGESTGGGDRPPR